MPADAITTANRGYTLVRKALNQSEVWDWFAEYVALWNSVDADIQSLATILASHSTAFANRAAATLEWTGITDGGRNSTIGVTYDPTARTVTLSGTFTAYFRGQPVTELTDGWESVPHGENPTAPLFLKYASGIISWSTTPWTFDDLQIAYVAFDPSGNFLVATREVHGFMSWSTHDVLHHSVGTVRRSGGDVAGYVLGGTAATNRRPTTSECMIQDEDLETVLAAHTSKDDYSVLYLTGATGVPSITRGADDMVGLAGASLPLWNEWDGAAWVQTGMANGDYLNVWEIAMPATADAVSQQTRFVWMVGQATYATLADAQAETVQSLNYGTFEPLAPEFVPITRVTIRYLGSDWSWAAVERLTGSRASTIVSPSETFLSTVASTDDFSGLGTPSSPLALSSELNIEATLDEVTDRDKRLARTIDASNGHVTGINAAALKNDAVNRLALQRMAMPLFPVLSVVDTLPASPSPGDRHLLSSSATEHAGDIAQAVPDVLDYTTWTSYSSADESLPWGGVCWSPELNLFCATAGTGTGNKVMVSPNGREWTSVASADDSLSWGAVCWAPTGGPLKQGLFCAVSSYGTGNRVMTSPDGFEWTQRESADDTKAWYSICWAEESGIFCAVSSDSVMTSPDGITWTERTATGDHVWSSVCWAPTGGPLKQGLFCAVGMGGLGSSIMTSPDGITWSSQTEAANNEWSSVCWSPKLELFCAVAYMDAGNRVMTSHDGITWALQEGTDYGWYRICWSNELEMFCGLANISSATRIVTSTDGIVWTPQDTVSGTAIGSICWSPEVGAFCVVMFHGTNRVLMSDVGTRWMYEQLQEGQSVYDQENRWTWTKQGGVVSPSFEFVLRGTTAVTTTDETVEADLYLNPDVVAETVVMPSGWGAAISIELSASFTYHVATIKGYAWWTEQSIAASSWETQINTFAGTLTISTPPGLGVDEAGYGLKLAVAHTTASFIATGGDIIWTARVKGVPVSPVQALICV